MDLTATGTLRKGGSGAKVADVRRKYVSFRKVLAAGPSANGVRHTNSLP